MKRGVRRMRYRVRQRVHPTTVDQADVEAALRAAGLGQGDAVFFQSAMSPFGEIRGGPETVLSALDAVVGDRGLIAMPAFPMVGGIIEYLETNPTFDVRQSPSTMGAISERFRQDSSVRRSLHPTHSVSARGPGAEVLVEGHESAPTPFGQGTPFARLLENDAHQVWFGCGVAAFTMYHTFECLHTAFPIKVFLDDKFSLPCVDANGMELNVTTLVHDPEVSRHRIDANPANARRWHQLLLDRGHMRAVALGRGEVLAIRLSAMMEDLQQLLEEGRTIYALRGGAGSDT
jgi:aminoglycoside 3-N-acetyltransferase